MNVDDYLNRINSLNFRENSVQNLFRLQQNHLLNVPFENLDVHLNKKVKCSLEELYEKVIVKKRGGKCLSFSFCCLNFFFYYLILKSLRAIFADRTISLLCLTVFLSYLPEAGQYSCFFVYLKLIVGFSPEQVAYFIAYVGILSCIAQVNIK